MTGPRLAIRILTIVSMIGIVMWSFQPSPTRSHSVEECKRSCGDPNQCPSSTQSACVHRINDCLREKHCAYHTHPDPRPTPTPPKPSPPKANKPPPPKDPCAKFILRRDIQKCRKKNPPPIARPTSAVDNWDACIKAAETKAEKCREKIRANLQLSEPNRRKAFDVCQGVLNDETADCVRSSEKPLTND